MGGRFVEGSERLVILDFGVSRWFEGRRIVEEEIYFLDYLRFNEHRIPKWTKGVCWSFTKWLVNRIRLLQKTNQIYLSSRLGQTVTHPPLLKFLVQLQSNCVLYFSNTGEGIIPQGGVITDANGHSCSGVSQE